MHHQWCYKIFIPLIQSKIDSLTVNWFLDTTPFLKGCDGDYLLQTSENILSFLHKNKTIPSMISPMVQP